MHSALAISKGRKTSSKLGLIMHLFFYSFHFYEKNGLTDCRFRSHGHFLFKSPCYKENKRNGTDINRSSIKYKWKHNAAWNRVVACVLHPSVNHCLKFLWQLVSTQNPLQVSEYQFGLMFDGSALISNNFASPTMDTCIV